MKMMEKVHGEPGEVGVLRSMACGAIRLEVAMGEGNCRAALCLRIIERWGRCRAIEHIQKKHKRSMDRKKCAKIYLRPQCIILSFFAEQPSHSMMSEAGCVHDK